VCIAFLTFSIAGIHARSSHRNPTMQLRIKEQLPVINTVTVTKGSETYTRKHTNLQILINQKHLMPQQ
jgi:hypothetical protein